MSKKARRHGGTEARRGAWGDLVVSGRHAFVAVCLMIVLAGAAAGQTEDSRSTDATPAGLAFRVAKLVAMDDADTVINDAVVLVKGSEIEALGPADQVKVPEGYRVLDFPEHWLVPGIVEAHDHSAAGWWNDLNDMVYQTNPGLDTRCIPPPDNDWIKAARTGGVTTVLLLPGSGTNLAGMGTVVSTGGSTPDEIIMRSPGSLKVAQAGNPEWYFGGNGRSFMNWNLRQTIEKARAYHEKWAAYEEGTKAARQQVGWASPTTAGNEATRQQGNETTTQQDHGKAARDQPAAPEFDPAWDMLRGVFRGDYPVAVHTQIYQVLMTTVDMFATKFRLWTVTEHSCFDAWKVGPVVHELEGGCTGAPGLAPLWTIQGPRQYHFDYFARRMIGNAAGWWKNGVRNLGINTDAPVVPQQELTYQATMACWYGWLPYPALHAITSINAKSIGVYDRVGSVETHKQADLSIWTGDPLDPRSACLMTVVRGKIVYDGTKGLRRF